MAGSTASTAAVTTMSKQTLAQLLEAAVSHHKAGNLKDAEHLYLQALEQDPKQPDALNLLGVLAQHHGEITKALGLFEKAIAVAPHLASLHFNKGKALHDEGRKEDAKTAYETALSCDPQFLDAILNLGVLLQETNQTKPALQRFNTLIKLVPDHQKAHYNIGKCYHTQGRFDEALSTFNKALDLNPNDHVAHFAIANTFNDIKHYDDAIKHIKIATTIKPEWAQAYNALGLTLLSANAFEDAVTACKKAAEIDPKSVHQIALGIAYLAAGQEQEAGVTFSQAKLNNDNTADDFTAFTEIAHDALGPHKTLQILEHSLALEQTPMALNNISAMLQDMGCHSLATPYFEAALKLDPGYTEASTRLGCLMLTIGDIEKASHHLSARLTDKKFTSTRSEKTNFWHGEALDSKTILVFFTDGLGEHIIQSAFISEIAKHTQNCIVECSKRLAPILKRAYPNIEFVSGYDQALVTSALERSDFQIPALNIGLHFHKALGHFPKVSQNLLTADADLETMYRSKYAKLANGRKIVGVSWISGNLKIGKYKTLGLEALEPILNPEEMFLVNLQYGPVSEAIEEFSKNTGIQIYTDPTVDQFKELEPFFAQVAATDLVITISNTTAHVAGSLGVPTWVMLPKQGMAPLWFWFMDRSDSPWYPSVRLFRQQSAPSQDHSWWPEVIDDVAAALPQWLAAPLAPRP